MQVNGRWGISGALLPFGPDASAELIANIARLEAEAEVPDRDALHLVHEMLTCEYRKALDQPVPMLGDRTPRALASTKAGKVKVAEWLKYLENGSAKARPMDDPMATFEFTWMWEELGVADLRK